MSDSYSLLLGVQVVWAGGTVSVMITARHPVKLTLGNIVTAGAFVNGNPSPAILPHWM